MKRGKRKKMGDKDNKKELVKREFKKQMDTIKRKKNKQKKRLKIKK